MGRVVLVCRLAMRDLRHRRIEATLLLLVITTASAILTLGLVLHGVTSQPYQHTRTETAGPDVVANVVPSPSSQAARADVAGLAALRDAAGVTGSSGPYPVTGAELRAGGHRALVEAEGRDRASAAVDQPRLSQGSWVRPGAAVIERAFADALGVHPGDTITLNGRSFHVAGTAVTAALSPYPSMTCIDAACWFGTTEQPTQPLAPRSSSHPHPGLVWLTQADARALAPHSVALGYLLNLRLADPSAARAFVTQHSSGRLSAPTLQSWQDIAAADAELIQNEQRALLTASALLALLAIASITVLVGGRMADQHRRAGLLKAVGASPPLIAAVLLSEYVVLALVAAAAGLGIGWQIAPLLTRPSAGLVGTAGAVPLTASTAVLVIVVALAVAAMATFIPAVRASRTSTVLALADSPRLPRRSGWLIAASAPLPAALLLGVRIAARRPRRLVLAVTSIAVTVAGIVAVLAANAQLTAQRAPGSTGLADPRIDRLNHVLLLITIMLIALAAVNTIVITWSTVVDTRHASALTRALGATPHQVSAALSAAQTLPALAGALLGIPAGIALFESVSPSTTTLPHPWWLLAVLVATTAVVAGLTVIPAHLGARYPAAEILRSESA